MKKILSVLSALTLLISPHVFAEPASCPSVDTIRATQFTRAYNMGPPEWIAITNITNTNGAEWTVSADFIGNDLKTELEALTYLNKKIQVAPLTEPEAGEDDGSTICHYARGYGFELIAINPAIHPQIMKHFMVK